MSVSEDFSREAEPGRGAPRFIPPRQHFFEILGSVSNSQAAVLAVLGVVGWLGAWELVHFFTPEAHQKFVPGPGQVISEIFHLIVEKNFVPDVGKSLYRVYLSFAVACLVAVPLGLFMGAFVKVKALINPTVGGWRYLPAASFVPLLLVYFGPTDLAKLTLLFLGCVFFLIALILDDVLSVPKELIESAQTMGASRGHIICRVIFPAAAPRILDSMRNMIAVSWTYLVIAEIVAATDGIGAVMMRASRFFHVETIMAGILVIGILGVMTDIIFRQASRILFPYTFMRR
ncbi:ABC transporter permease [Sneathiella litorea]|uniref:ABC transporter permease subunit n=1 Tax=Sneathiella litorea TaxID=2606216 RepID=A0A6L8W598_9PROT|nr:ABC transporter permease [Sneathiella litorea]MZR29634.1 ABC transporter permease subunit [Sneathiella litorea]